MDPVQTPGRLRTQLIKVHTPACHDCHDDTTSLPAPLHPGVTARHGSLTHANAERPLMAKEGVAYFTEQALQWRSHIERLDEEGLARPVGEPEAYLDAPMA